MFAFCFATAFLTSSFGLMLIEERTSKAKLIQFLSGIHPLSYWSATFTWNLLVYMVPSTIFVILTILYPVYTLGPNISWSDQNLLFLFFGWAILPNVYLISFISQTATRAYVWMTNYSIITGTFVISLALIIFFICIINYFNFFK